MNDSNPLGIQKKEKPKHGNRKQAGSFNNLNNFCTAVVNCILIHVVPVADKKYFAISSLSGNRLEKIIRVLGNA
jgi:hypothetical protein